MKGKSHKTEAKHGAHPTADLTLMKKLSIILVIGVVAFGIYFLFFPAPEIRNANPSGENIICFGDSLTYGTGSTQGMDYPSQLSGMISKPVVNAGVPGNTTADALSRLEEDVLSGSPRIVLITLGGNDLKNRVPREEAFQNLKTIITAIQDRGALVIIGGIEIPFWGRGFGDAYEKLCDELGVVLIPNIFEDLLGNRELMSDPIHPNDAGYAIMAQRFYKAIEPYL